MNPLIFGNRVGQLAPWLQQRLVASVYGRQAADTFAVRYRANTVARLRELAGQTMGWAELMGRTLQLSLHHRMLSDFERLRDRAKVVLLCPVLGPGEGLDMRRDHLEATIEGVRQATLRLLREQGRGIFARSAIHYIRA